MNSLYKKIALVCLVSLTANQVANAFQFSDVLNWIKGNQKKAVAIYVGILALALAPIIYGESRRLTRRYPMPVRNQPAINHDAEIAAALAQESEEQEQRKTQAQAEQDQYEKERRAKERAAILDRDAQSAKPVAEEADEGAQDFVPAHYEYATYVDKACLACPTEHEFNRLTGEECDVPARTDVLSLDTLSDADHKRLAELSPNPCQPGKSYYPPGGHNWRHEYLSVVRDQNKDIAGCLWYWHGHGDYARIHVFNVQGKHAKQIKKSLLTQLLHARKHDTTKYDVSTYEDSPERALVRKTVQEVDGHVREDRGKVFRRNDPEVDDLFRARITSHNGHVKWCNTWETYPKPGEVPSVQYYEERDLKELEARRERGRKLLEMRRKQRDEVDRGFESFADLGVRS